MPEVWQDWPQGYDGHRRAQRKRVLLESTPEQRLHWLEDTLLLLWRNGFIPPQTFLSEWPETAGEERQLPKSAE